MWDIEVCNLLKTSLPDDANQSRILFTSRFQNLSLQIKPDSKPHHLRSFTDKESWELLQIKLFGNVGCPPSLCEVGIQIAKNCKGLPLSVVLVTGILATATQDCAMWEEVAKSLGSSIVLEAEQCMKTLEKSYIHLPDHLKPCLLYFSAFPEDKDIPVQSLLWLWISEGFVDKTEGKSLEDVAHKYLMDLIARSLVMATKQRARGGAKACRVHDLVHDFCMAKAKEESFLHTLQHGDIFTYTGLCNPYRLCIYSPTGSDQKSVELEQSGLYFPYLRSLLFFANGAWTFDVLDFCTGFRMFKLLRVLDLGEPFFVATCFPKEVTLLVHLRLTAIGNLSRLETFLVRGCITDVLLPNTIWNIKTLRHLYITRSEKGFSFPIDSKLEDRLDLKNLATLALAIDPSSQSLQKILTKLPSIRKIRCTPLGSRESTGNHNGIFVLDYLSQLESLNMRGFVGYEFEFPLNLKKLTLSSNHQPWSEISVIGKLPNLEVLKLESSSFVGEKWEMKEGEFCRLRFLKLLLLDIRIWTASYDNFSCLEKLVLHICPHLEEVPSCLGEIPTLEVIEVKFCPESALSYVKQIQMEMGNEGLKIVTERCW
ncbi:putative late blight resistance protein homolog R1A-10 [Coffea eugenioides]|uniref:putative late blight resistance protein homolog R1A-10 n=1 Tax=Coffea eugenioides TaxID=49369 RepID=UPI000F614504|nr:putative late blight resistance protein homolog R1A-10 [Coffea eugenioides]